MKRTTANHLLRRPIPRDLLLEKAAPANDFSSSKLGELVIILAFSEAHALIDQMRKDLPLMWSALSELCRSLRVVSEQRLSSVFLSTTGKIAQFTPPKQRNSSMHMWTVSLISIIPFSNLGFHQLARKIAIDGSCNLEDVASDAHMVALGLPLKEHSDLISNVYDDSKVY